MRRTMNHKGTVKHETFEFHDFFMFLIIHLRKKFLGLWKFLGAGGAHLRSESLGSCGGFVDKGAGGGVQGRSPAGDPSLDLYESLKSF